MLMFSTIYTSTISLLRDTGTSYYLIIVFRCSVIMYGKQNCCFVLKFCSNKSRLKILEKSSYSSYWYLLLLTFVKTPYI